MRIEIDDVEIEAKANAMLETAVLNVINEHIGGYVFARTVNDRVKELCNSSLDKVAHDLVQELKPRMREDVMAAYQSLVKAKAARMMKALEKE